MCCALQVKVERVSNQKGGVMLQISWDNGCLLVKEVPQALSHHVPIHEGCCIAWQIGDSHMNYLPVAALLKSYK